MKCKVLRPFLDKYTGERIEAEYECSEKRFKEIQKQGNFLEPIEKEKENERNQLKKS